MIRATLTASLALLGAGTARAQTGAVLGAVTDRETGQPLAGAQVMLVGTQRGVLANEDGQFILPGVPVGSATVRVQRIGYASAEQSVVVTDGGTVRADFALQPQAVELEKLVVTGYGEQRREDLTGSVASVSSKDFVEAPARDAASLIVGKVAGLNITTTSGDPTDESEISLRGITTIDGPREPLVIVDGVPANNTSGRSALDLIAPQDIESIDVLKDGSAAAVYGSRASNGVILITTKKYEAGTPPTIRYDGFASAQSLYKSPDFLDAAAYREKIAEGYAFEDLGYTTNWQDQVLRQPVSFTNNLTLTGGAENTHYTASLGYQDKQGIFQRSDLKELSGRINVGHTMFDGALQTDLNLLTRVNDSFIGADYGYAWRQVLIRNPTDRVYDDDGTYQLRGVYFYPNPVGLVDEYNGDREDRILRLNGTVTLQPIQNLKLAMTAGTERFNRLDGYSNTQMAVNSQLSTYLSASRGTRADVDRTLDLTGTYSNDFAGHYVTLLGGYSYQDYTQEWFNASNSELPTDLFGYNDLGSGDALSEGRAGMGSDKWGYKVIGFFGRMNYAYNNRYLLSASLRYEGNSKFGADHKWGVFPGVSAGWRISEESFMQGSPFNDLKFRVGYGITGIAPDAPYLSLTSYSYSSRFPFRGSWVQGIRPARNPNPDLRWERKEEINLGLDFSLFDYRLAGTVEAYRRDTRDMLYNYDVPSPPYLTGGMLANVGRMQNKGLEVSLTYDVIRKTDLRWQANANWSTNANKLVSLSNDVFSTDECFMTGYTGEPVQKSTHRVCVGEPIGNFWGLKSVDVDENGAWIIQDTLGNRVPIDGNGDQYQVLGNGIPKHYVAFNNSIRYKRVDLAVNMRGAFGFQILDFLRMYYENPSVIEYNRLKSAFDPVYGKQLLANPLDLVSYYVEDGDYWKLDNVTLGYTFDPGSLPLLNRAVSAARVYVAGRNLLVLTGYKGIDPEVSTSGLAPGDDNRDWYPTTRTFTAGLSLTF